MKVRIGHLSTFYHTAVLLMADRETDSRLGAEAQWRLMGTGPAIVDALGRGELDLAYIGLPPAIVGIARGVDIRCIAGGHMEGTVFTGKTGDTAPAGHRDLGEILGQYAGRKMGVPGKGSIHDVILAESLARYGLQEAIEVVNFQWADFITEALARDEISAAFGTPALAVAAERYAGCKTLYPPSMLWPDNPSYGILASGEFLERQRPLIERFLSLHEEATGRLRQRPREAAEAIAQYVGFIDREFVLDTIALSPRYCAQLTQGYVASTMEFVGALKRLGYIGREPGQEEIFDTSLIEKVHGPGNHYGRGLDL